MSEPRLLMVGCGILEKEITWLIEKNAWPLDTLFLDSALHIDLGKLYLSLRSALAKHADRMVIVFYGECHPLMDKLLAEAEVARTPGQNCMHMLLGDPLFSEELSKGAFFLLDDWAVRWEEVVTRALGKKADIIRAIFREDRKYLLGLRTPCSGDFTVAAEKAAELVGLPLRWMDVPLDNLEAIFQSMLDRKIGATYARDAFAAR
jgi:hypothetical protein